MKLVRYVQIEKRKRVRSRLRTRIITPLKKRTTRKSSKRRFMIVTRKKRRFRNRRFIQKRRKFITVRPLHAAQSAQPELQPSTLPLPVEINLEPPLHPPPQLNPGVSLIGYTRTEIGLGEASRMLAKSFEAVQLPFGILSHTDPGASLARNQDISWVHKEINHAPYQVNVLHLNPPNLRWAYDLDALPLGRQVLYHRYNIGYWAWEMPVFPDEWCNAFELVHEVWVPSSFIVDSIQKKSTVPVIQIPHAIEVQGYVRNRSIFHLPDKPYLFLSMYDTHSLNERKNPQGSIQAFKSAFAANDTSVGLVIKVNNAHTNPAEMEHLKSLIQGYTNIYLIQETMSREKVDMLLNSTDCFISLHRSEGFGLVLAEAMYLGKPVIGTNWSGNTDFMNANNSCPVNYSLTQLGRDIGPYQAFQTWAEPDIQHAAFFMRKLVSDNRWRSSIALQGQQTIRNEYSPKVIANMIKKRLGEIGIGV